MWCYKFTFRGEQIRQSTKQNNKRIAQQIEAAHKTALAKGEVGIRERKPIPSLADFAKRNFMPSVGSSFKAKPKTFSYYKNGVERLLEFEPLARERLDRITSEKILVYASKRQGDGLQTSSINRELQVLRRMFRLAQEWDIVDKAWPRVKMIPGERHRERVLSFDEEDQFLLKASTLTREVSTILLDCGLRPEECFRLRWANVTGDCLEIHFGKTGAARRRIPMTQRVAAVLEMRRETAESDWVFSAPTKSGQIEPSSLKKQHAKALLDSRVSPFPLYTFRHTCLTRWAPHMDPWTLAYLAGHQDMNITKRYVHPQTETIQKAMEKVRGGHKTGHIAQSVAVSKDQQALQTIDSEKETGAPGVIRTRDLLVRSYGCRLTNFPSIPLFPLP